VPEAHIRWLLTGDQEQTTHDQQTCLRLARHTHLHFLPTIAQLNMVPASPSLRAPLLRAVDMYFSEVPLDSFVAAC